MRIKNYQIRKLVDFLESLQSLPPIRQYFSDGGFRSALIFPYLEVRRKKSWCVELAISERLYFYQYPFSFPKNFLICDQKYQLRVQLFFFELKKEFQMEKFFQTFSISNSKTKNLRNYMIELFATLEVNLDGSAVKRKMFLQRLNQNKMLPMKLRQSIALRAM